MNVKAPNKAGAREIYEGRRDSQRYRERDRGTCEGGRENHTVATFTSIF